MKEKTNKFQPFVWLVEFVIGNNPDDQKYRIFLYVLATAAFLVSAVISLIAIVLLGVHVTIGWIVVRGIVGYLFCIGVVRVVAMFPGMAKTLYLGGRGLTRGGDDFSQIEALVSAGRYDDAIARYNEEYAKRGGGDERPRIRIGEVYQFRMRDYQAAISQYALIARTTSKAEIRLDVMTRMLELYRDHLPDNPDFDVLCRKVLKEFSGSFAAGIAKQHLS